MPVPSLGPCVWKATTNPNDPVEPVPAIVTQVGQRSVMLTVFAPDNRGGLPKDGVRHISDPELGDHPNYEGGCWDFTPDQVLVGVLRDLVMSFGDELADTRKELADLKKAVGA